jgi:hypothetical protein
MKHAITSGIFGENKVQPQSVCFSENRRRCLPAGEVIHISVDGFGSSS